MTWDQELETWKERRARRRDYAPQKRVSEHDVVEGGWLRSSLLDPTEKAFVAQVFGSQRVPEAFFPEMIRAGVYERDPSFNRYFVQPCVRDFGAFRVFEAL